MEEAILFVVEKRNGAGVEAHDENERSHAEDALFEEDKPETGVLEVASIVGVEEALMGQRGRVDAPEEGRERPQEAELDDVAGVEAFAGRHGKAKLHEALNGEKEERLNGDVGQSELTE